MFKNSKIYTSTLYFILFLPPTYAVEVMFFCHVCVCVCLCMCLCVFGL